MTRNQGTRTPMFRRPARTSECLRHDAPVFTVLRPQGASGVTTLRFRDRLTNVTVMTEGRMTARYQRRGRRLFVALAAKDGATTQRGEVLRSAGLLLLGRLRSWPAQIFLAVGIGRDGFARFVDRLREDIARPVHEHELAAASFTAAPPGTTELCARRSSFLTSASVIKRRVLPYGG